MLGGYPRKAGEERADVMARNVSIYRDQAAALELHASPDVKVRGRAGGGGGGRARGGGDGRAGGGGGGVGRAVAGAAGDGPACMQTVAACYTAAPGHVGAMQHRAVDTCAHCLMPSADAAQGVLLQ